MLLKAKIYGIYCVKNYEYCFKCLQVIEDCVSFFETHSMSYIIISGFGIYGAAVVPDSGVGNASHSFSMNSCLTG